MVGRDFRVGGMPTGSITEGALDPRGDFASSKKLCRDSGVQGDAAFDRDSEFQGLGSAG